MLFSVAKNSSTASNNTIIFDEVTVQRGQYYDILTGSFKIPINGTYVFHFSTGVVPSSGIDMQMKAYSSTIAHIYRTSNSNNGIDTMSVSYIGTFTKDTQILLNLGSGTSTSNSLRQTSWSAFLLDNLMYPLIVFCTRPVSNTAPLVITDTKINFGTATVNIGNAWNSASDLFTAPRSGTYVFSFSFAFGKGKFCGVFLYVNSTTRKQQLVFSDFNHNGYDMTGTTAIISLATGDTVGLYYLGNDLYNDNLFTTSFAGFLYEPKNGRKVVWSVHLKSNFTQSQLDIVPFEDVSVNIGDGWNKTANKFVVPYAGVYQLHLTASLNAYSTVDYRLMWNNVSYASVLITSTNYNYIHGRSRSIMIKAIVGDIFHIAASTSGSFAVNPPQYRLTSFTGFLLSD